MKNFIAFFFVLVFGSGLAIAQAETVSFDATVSSVIPIAGDGAGLAANLGITVGDSVAGSYSYDVNHPDTVSGDPTLGLYNNIALPFSMTLQTASATYNFSSASNRITVSDQSFDEISVISLGAVSSDLPSGVTLGQLQALWNEQTGAALADDSLVVPPQFQWDFQRLKLLSFDDGAGNIFSLFAEINTFSGSGPGLGDIYAVSVGTDAIILVDPDTGAESVVSSGGLLSGNNPFGVAVEGNGDILVTHNGPNGGRILRIDPDSGAQSVVASGFINAAGITTEPNGDILFTDLNTSKVRRVDPVSGSSTVVSSGINISGPLGIGLEPNGDIVVTSRNNAQIVRIDPISGAQTVVSAGGDLIEPQWLAVNSSGDIFVTLATIERGAIVKVDPGSGAQSVVAAGGQLFSPKGIDVDTNGDLVVANGNNKILRVNPSTGVVTEIAGFGIISGTAGLAIAGTQVSADTDNDGVLDIDDNCINDPNPDQTDTDMDGEGDACDDDDDNDTILDGVDNCTLVANTDQLDFDGDSLGDACDSDLDGDGLDNGVDNCPAAANADQTDTDGDNAGDECDLDDDNDEILDASDNCPVDVNPDQLDLDDDGIGDVCDADVDGDGIDNDVDNCPVVSNPSQDDADLDGQGDACDDDDDNDTILDGADNCPLVFNLDQADLDGDSVGDLCDNEKDGDGVLDADDNCSLTPNPDQNDIDGDGEGDACDPDIDGDGVGNAADQCADTELGATVDPANGCTIAQLCPCGGPRGTTSLWRNHGKYVSCTAKASGSFLDQGLITEAEKDAIVSAAAMSACGSKK